MGCSHEQILHKILKFHGKIYSTTPNKTTFSAYTFFIQIYILRSNSSYLSRKWIKLLITCMSLYLCLHSKLFNH